MLQNIETNANPLDFRRSLLGCISANIFAFDNLWSAFLSTSQFILDLVNIINSRPTFRRILANVRQMFIFFLSYVLMFHM